jgi:hypothetical protein
VKRYKEALWGALDTSLHNIGVLLALNLATTLLLFPLLAILTFVLSSTGLLGAFPLSAGVAAAVLTCPLTAPLQTVINRMARGYSIWVLRESREVLQTYGFLLLRIWLLDLVVTIAMVANISFYTTHGPPVLVALRFVWIYILFAWLVIHVYIYPLIVEDRVTGILDTYRKTVQLSMVFPGFTLIVGVIWLALVALLSLTGVLALLGLAVTISLQHHALAAVLDRDPLES